MLFVDVIVPLPLDSTFTYNVPSHIHNIEIGCRVIVQFGKKKYYTAIVVRIHEDEANNETKEIVSVLDERPIILASQLEFWQWLSFYYMCPIGDVLKAALPSALKLESETFVLRIESFQAYTQLTPTEQQVFYELSETKPSKILEVAKTLKINNIVPHIKSLADKGAIYISESIKDVYTPKVESRIKLALDYTEEALSETLNKLSRAKKQQHLLSVFLNLQIESGQSFSDYSILKKDLLDQAQVSQAILNELIDKNILKLFIQEISRFDYGMSSPDNIKELNPFQQKAFNQIQEAFNNQSVVLLHGVTASGKTEIYIQLIQEALNKNKQVLYLLPEIALTTQITERLKSVFGDKLSVYHSRFTDNERAETWNTLLSKNGEGHVVLGARSSIFLPFNNLDLIIVDEEHESSYKQQDPAPRYNARNASIVLASIHKAKVLLGTATPSIESYFNALSGKYGLVSLTKRHEEIELPRIIPIDTKLLKKRKQMKSVLSPPLIKEINNALGNNKQVILFQNRRGFSPIIECKTCSWTKLCDHCDVSLTYHKGQRLMVCHYCGATYDIPEICPNCETPTLVHAGYGTERIEEEVQEIFPGKSIVRMDLDTTRSKKAYEQIISGVENQLTDILIGTQMVSKGLDFENVTIVGILNADSMLNYPDFRAHEKAFQLMTQVSGRAGRKNKQGLVMLQTSQPQNQVISCVVNNDYKRFYEMQIDERRMFSYPPFRRLISIVLKGRDERILQEGAKQFATSLRYSFGEKVMGPTQPVISRIQSLYIRTILLKIDNNASPKKIREAIKYHKEKFLTKPDFRSILMYFDVDPLV